MLPKAAAAFLALCAAAQSQTLTPATAVARPPLGPVAKPKIPADMKLCAPNLGCKDWIGTAEGFFIAFPNGTYAPVAVESFTPESVILHRADPPGSQCPGLTADYTAKIVGNSIVGSVTFYWPNHRGYPGTTTFTATWEPAAMGETAQLHKVPIEALKAQYARAEADEQMFKSFLFVLGMMFSGSGEDDSSKPFGAYRTYCGNTAASCVTTWHSYR
jgi:hypothetical protein